MPVIHGTASWPGVRSVVSCTYTSSHGTMPATAVLTCHPQPAAPAAHGSLVFSDGVRTVTIPRARLKGYKLTKDGSGTLWHLEIEDRRWRWRACGIIAGLYNQRDYRNKFIPWTVRTNAQLAALCLDAMGEKGYTVQVPNTTLLPIDWDHVNPAKALEDLAEGLGCRVVYRLDTDTVAVMPLGAGVGRLPSGSINKEGPQAVQPDVPDSLLLVGAPIRHQGRFKLVAVGEEWDGSLRELEHLSYKPTTGAQRQQVDIDFSNAFAGNTWRLVFDGAGTVTFTSTADGAAHVAAGLAAAVQASAHPRIRGRITASVFLGTTLELKGLQDGSPFDLKARAQRGTGPAGGEPPLMRVILDQAAKKSDNSWAACCPPHFANVQATDRLTYTQAVEKAKKSVFKYYALVNCDPANAKVPAFVPGFGRLARIQQAVPSMTQVEQVVPAPADARLIGRDGKPIVLHFYDGYSRDKPAQAFGSYFWPPTGVIHAKAQENSDPDMPVVVDFSIDETRLFVSFSDYVYKMDKGQCVPAELTLQTAVQVRGAPDNQIIRYLRYYEPPGQKAGTKPAVFRHEDIRLVFAGLYDAENKLTRVLDNRAECEAQALYYLTGHLLKFVPRKALERGYNGIMPIALDGTVHQVTWTVGESGAETTASLHAEHSTYIPPFPERRRLEYLSPVQMAQDPRAGAGANNVPGPSMAEWKNK